MTAAVIDAAVSVVPVRVSVRVAAGIAKAAVSVAAKANARVLLAAVPAVFPKGCLDPYPSPWGLEG